jgi:hypothetical protein
MTFSNTTVAFNNGVVLFNGATIAFGSDCCCGTTGTGSPGTCACYQFGTSASQNAYFSGYITLNVNDDDYTDNSSQWTVSIDRGTATIATGSALAGNLAPRDILPGISFFPFGFPFFFYVGSGVTIQTTASGTVNIGSPGDDFTPDGTPGTTAVGFQCNTGNTLPAAFKRFSLVGKSCAGPQYTGTVLIIDYPLTGTCANMSGTFTMQDACGGAAMKFVWGTASPVGTSWVATNNPDATLTVTGSTWTIDNDPASAFCGFTGTKTSSDALPPSGSWDFYPKSSVCSIYLDPNAPFVSVASRSFEDLHTGEVL